MAATKFQLNRTVSLENIIVMVGLLFAIAVGWENLRVRVGSLEEWKQESAHTIQTIIAGQQRDREMLIQLVTIAKEHNQTISVLAERVADPPAKLTSPRPRAHDPLNSKSPRARTSP